MRTIKKIEIRSKADNYNSVYYPKTSADMVEMDNDSNLNIAIIELRNLLSSKVDELDFNDKVTLLNEVKNNLDIVSNELIESTGTLSNKYTELSGDIESIQTNIENLEELIDNLEFEIDEDILEILQSLDTEFLASLESSITGLQDNINNHISDYDELSNAVNLIQSDINDSRGSYDSLKDRIDSLIIDPDIIDQLAQIDLGTLANVSVEIENLETELSNLSDDYNSLKLTVDGLEEVIIDSIIEKIENNEISGIQGEDGIDGKSLDFNWNGTELGVKKEGEDNFNYVDLKGESGSNVTKEDILTLLEYTPISESDLNSAIDIVDNKIDTNENAINTHINNKNNPHEISKSDIGLSNVDNTKDTEKPISNLTQQALDSKANISHNHDNDYYKKIEIDNTINSFMPLSGGVLENYTEKLVTVSSSSGNIDLNGSNVFTHTPSANITYSFNNAKAGAHSFTLLINVGETVRTFTFPNTVNWRDGEIPDLTKKNKTYLLTFLSVNEGVSWLGMFGGMF